MLAIWKLKAIHKFGSRGAIPVALRERGGTVRQTSVFPSRVKDGFCPGRPVSLAPILPCPTLQQWTSWHPLHRCTGFKTSGVTSIWLCFHPFYFLSFLLNSVPGEIGPDLQLVPQTGTNGTKLICTVKCTVMKAWPIRSELAPLSLYLGKIISTSKTEFHP